MEGDKDRETFTVGSIARVAVLVTPLAVAVIETVTLFDTLDVVIAKTTDDAPGLILTVAGTFASDFELDSSTLMPPAGAGPLSTRVPVAVAPPDTAVGARVRLCSVGG